MADKIFDYTEETQSQRLARKTKESPFMIIGLTGMFFAVCYGGYKFKNRGNMSASLYLGQLRVIAQGMAVGTLALGMLNEMYQKHQEKTKKSEA